MKMKKTYQQYTKEFKEQAVRLCEQKERPMSEIARSLKINQSLLCRWVKASQEDGAEAFRGHGVRTGVEQELYELRKENLELEQELDFLKKVSRYFAKLPK